MLYNGWFYLAGELLEAGERMTDAGLGFQYFFRASHRPKAFADLVEDVLALEFSAKLAWARFATHQQSFTEEPAQREPQLGFRYSVSKRNEVCLNFSCTFA